MNIGIGQGPQHQTCTFEICNFHFHYGINLTSSGIQVKSMQNVNCTLEIVGKYYIYGVFYMQKCISQIVHVLLLLLVPVDETKLNNRSTIKHDTAHVGTWYWWLVHRHHFFSLTPSLLEILMIILRLHVLCVLKIQV